MSTAYADQQDEGSHELDDEERIHARFLKSVRDGKYEEVAGIIRENRGRSADVDRGSQCSAATDLDVDRKDATQTVDVSAGPSPGSPDRCSVLQRHQKSALHIACENGDGKLIKLLLTARADVNIKTKCFEELPCKRVPDAYSPLRAS